MSENMGRAYALIPEIQNGSELDEVQQLIQQEMAEGEDGFDHRLMRYKIAPGGIGQFWLGSDDRIERTFTAIAVVSHKIRGFWPRRGQNSPPMCSSVGGRFGEISGELSMEDVQAAKKARVPHPAVTVANPDLSQKFSCIRCPMNRWGSDFLREDGESPGRGKACKEMRRLLLLVDGIMSPVVMSLPPTSIVPWDEYCSYLFSQGSYYFATKTRFSLESDTALTGQTYNYVKLTQDDPLDVDTLKKVIQFRKDHKESMSDMNIGVEDYETQAPVSDDDDDEQPFQQRDEEIEGSMYTLPHFGADADENSDDIPF